jgi:hypothetical protein
VTGFRDESRITERQNSGTAEREAKRYFPQAESSVAFVFKS